MRLAPPTTPRSPRPRHVHLVDRRDHHRQRRRDQRRRAARQAAVELRGHTRNTDGTRSWPPAPPPADGSVAFDVTPERTTHYVVRLVRTEERAARAATPSHRGRPRVRTSRPQGHVGKVIAVAGLLKSQGVALKAEVTLQQLDPGATSG